MGSPTSGLISNEPGTTILGVPITSAKAPGWVEHTFSVDTQAQILEYVNLHFDHCGCRPTNRISLWQQTFDHALNKINGSGSLGGNIDDPSEVGGLPVVSSVTVDHETSGDPIPSGTNRVNTAWGYEADFSIQSSGRTELEDWYHRRNGDVMPAGWDN